MRVLILGCVLVALGCGGTAPHRDRISHTSDVATARITGSAAPRATTFEAALAPLRPEGAEPLLAALTASPGDPHALAAAATFYAGTDAGGMTLLWGLTWAALVPSGDGTTEVAVAISRVLSERVAVVHRGADHRVMTTLAPGALPLRADADGFSSAPIAHLVELDLLEGLWSFDHSGRLSNTTMAFVRWVEARRDGSPLEPHVELLAWLRMLADAGHLEPFVAAFLAPAFADDDGWLRGRDAAIADARAFATAHAFVPTQAVLPDDVVPYTPL